MKRFMATAFTVLAVSAAQARPAAQSLTCADAQRVVRSQGAVVMDLSPNTYDRVVRDSSFCSGGTLLQPSYARTRDSQSCFIGYICAPRLNLGTGGI